uniref:Phosphate-specific transport system accessory protein PhoU n=1 Tax=candidate division WOR-3 bacterium TaxID=2052148 RepID=A0A7V4E481_UNCW3
MLEDKIKELNTEILEYHAHVSNMFKQSIEGLLTRNPDLLKKVIEKDEPYANEKENLIDELCLDFIALYSPKAKILRTVTMILKMNNDLERVGDHATNIAQSALTLINYPEIKELYALISIMASKTLEMLRESLEAYMKEDITLATSVLKKDDDIDRLNQEIVKKSTSLCSQQLINPEMLIEFTSVSSNIERVADHATNLAEDVIYAVSGKIYRHGHFKDNLDTSP